MGEGVARWLLTLYPDAFREQYGEGMTVMYAQRVRDARASRGALGRLLFYVRELGSLAVGAIRERLRLVRRPARRRRSIPLTTLLRDLRLGVRMLGKHRGTTIIAVIALGLGIGLTTTMFSVIKGHAFARLPFDHPGQLVSLRSSNLSEGRPNMGVLVDDLLDWREATSFEGMSAWSRTSINLSDEKGPERYAAAMVTAELFDLLRVPPVLGRTLQASDGRPGAPLVERTRALCLPG